MATLTVNGTQVRVRLMDVDLSKLRLDPENPRLHSFYLTHELPAEPSQLQLAAVLESLPEFQSLLDAIARNNGCFHPPLVTQDMRVLEGNRRVAALRRLRSEHPQNGHWQKVTVQQINQRITGSQEKAIRAKYHLEGMLAWDSLSQLTEYLALAEREGEDCVATMLGRFRSHIEPLLVAGRCVRLFSQTYPQLHSQELLWVLVGLCGVKQLEPEVTFSRATRCIYTDKDDARPTNQPFSLANIMRWLTEGRFTKAYQEGERQFSVRPTQAPQLFRRVRLAGEEVMAAFLEPDGSLAKALALMQEGAQTNYRQQRQALNQTQKYMELLNQLRSIRKEESPDLHREALACYHRLEQLLELKRKERHRVHASRH
jgi:hypothetical protein